MQGVLRWKAAAWFCAAVLATGFGAIGCAEKKDRAAELGALLASGEYEEVQARVTLAREAGESGPWLDFAEGVALLEEGSDTLAFRLLETAAAEQPELARAAAETLARRARADQEAGWTERPRIRMARALVLDPGTPLGDMIDEVADYLYRFEKDYDRAYPLYRELADTVRAQAAESRGARASREWLFRYGHCLERQGSLDAAMMVYQEYLHLFPNDLQTKRFVMWRYMNGLITQAEEARGLQDLDLAIHKLEETQVAGWHLDLQQRARYLAGEIEQSRGRLEEARGWYQKVLDDGSQFGGEIVDQAKLRIDELRNQGVH